MRNLVVVGEGKPVVVQVLVAIHCFTDANCVAICAKGTRAFRFSSLCREYMEINFHGEDDDKFVVCVNLLADAMPGLTLIPADCSGTRMTNRVRKRLKPAIIPSPDAVMLDCLEDKWRFFQFCTRHGLNVPPTCYIGSKHDLQFAPTARQLGVPFVVKPVDRQASDGVYVISSEEDYDRKIRDNAAYQYTPLIAQRYIRGTDVGLNLLSIEGRVTAIAIQQPIEQHRVGSGIRFFPNDYLESVAHILCEKISYSGVMNIDARIEDGSNRVFLFESNPRFWRTLLASVWCGLNFVAESIDPGSREHGPRILTAGVADTFYHPLFRPSLWRYAVSDFTQRGRLVRAMAYDVSTLLSSTRAFLLSSLRHRSQMTVASTERHVRLAQTKIPADFREN